MTAKLEIISSNGNPQSGPTKTEAVRLAALPDRFLGRALVRMARLARSEIEEAEGPRMLGFGFVSAFLRGAVPEIAARLGEADPESFLSRRKYGALEGRDFREAIWFCHHHCPIRLSPALTRQMSPRGREAWSLLRRDPLRGNPVFIGMERVAALLDERPDSYERHLRSEQRKAEGEVANDGSPSSAAVAALDRLAPGIPPSP